LFPVLVSSLKIGNDQEVELQDVKKAKVLIASLNLLSSLINEPNQKLISEHLSTLVPLFVSSSRCPLSMVNNPNSILQLPF